MSKVVVEAYNKEWAKEFKILKEVYANHLKEFDVTIEHVGSTSVVGLDAKPILDIDIVMHDKKERDEIIRKIEEVGYEHRGDLGIKGREAFGRVSDKAPYSKEKSYRFKHHLYLCEEGIVALQNHLVFRDYLKTHDDAVKEYARIKRELAEKYPNDIDSYCEEKTEFITSILEKAGLDMNDIDDISDQNKVDRE